MPTQVIFVTLIDSSVLGVYSSPTKAHSALNRMLRFLGKRPIKITSFLDEVNNFGVYDRFYENLIISVEPHILDI